ncbi:MAG: ATP-binding protein [Chloroflexota bacterium]
MSRIARDLRPELAEAARVRRNEALLADASQIGRMGAWELDPGTGAAAWTEHSTGSPGSSLASPSPPTRSCASPTPTTASAWPPRSRRLRTAAPTWRSGSSGFDGTERSVVATRRVVPADETTASLEVGVVRDVTEERALEEQLRQAQRVESLGLLTGGVAHDFNNLLTAIGGFAELARLAAADGDSPEADLLQVEAAVQRARALTSQLLSFGRRSIVRARPVSLAAAVSALAPIVGRLLGARIAILTELDPGANALIDPGQLDQVIVNLAVNARDAMPDGGNLRIAAGQLPATGGEPARAWLEVEDDGSGMPPEVLDQIFTPFFTTKERGRGTGLGLSTVQGIVEQAGGRSRSRAEWARGRPSGSSCRLSRRPRLGPPRTPPRPPPRRSAVSCCWWRTRTWSGGWPSACCAARASRSCPRPASPTRWCWATRCARTCSSPTSCCRAAPMASSSPARCAPAGPACRCSS